MASANNQFKSHEEFRRAKELEEARKAGIAPAEVDEEGKEINPHIPQYMSSAPWYLNDTRPSLKHQKNWMHQDQDDHKYYDRGVKVFQAKKWRKGACENCGSITHKSKDCMERPRVKGAKLTNKNIAADEKVEDIKLVSFDAKRDRWNGYDAGDYSKIIDMHERVEQTKQEMRRKQELDKRLKADEDSSESEEDEYLVTEEQEAGFGKVEKRVRTTAGGASGSVRNLRIREDTAKYLLNLDPNSAHYDPKSRSMREDPNPDKPASQKFFSGDNFVRQNGDYVTWQALNLHSVTAQQKGQDLHMQGVPSQAEALFQQFKQKKEQLLTKTNKSVLEKYGNAAEQPPEDVAVLDQTEAYLEYDASGRVIKGQELKRHSRYEEDVHINNHTAVWGSWWHDGVWGYACCHQTLKNSYCTGAAGEQAAIESAEQMQRNMQQKALEEDRKRKESTLTGVKPGSEGVWGTETDESVKLDPEKLKAAIKRQEEGEGLHSGDPEERKRKYTSLQASEVEVTPEEMEAYRMKRGREEDPLIAIKAATQSGYDYV